MIGVTNNSPTQINAALIALKGEVKNEVKNEIINNIDNSVIGETYTAGDGIDITNAVISQTTDQLTFTGTQAQWQALTSAEKAKYGLVNRTDNNRGVYKNNNGTLELITGKGDISPYLFTGASSNIYSSSNYDQTVAHNLTKNLTLDKGLYFLRAMARNVNAGVVSNNILIKVGGFTFINCWETSNAGWSDTIDAVVIPIGSSQSCVVTVSQPVGFQYEVSITKLS